MSALPKNYKPVEIAVAIEVSAELDRQGIRHVAIGTLGLYLYGYDVEVPDLDFLVERLPDQPRGFETTEDDDSAGTGAWHVHGVKVDLIPITANNGAFSQFNLPAMLDSWVRILTVPVAFGRDIIRLKRAANRPKDLEFLKKFNF